MKAFLILLISGMFSLTAAAQTTDTTARVPMRNVEFNKLVKEAKSQRAFDEEAIRTAFLHPDTYYSTAQVRRLLKVYPKDSDKLIVARAIYSHVVDAGNYAQLANAFNSDTYSRAFVYWLQEPDKDIISTARNR